MTDAIPGFTKHRRRFTIRPSFTRSQAEFLRELADREGVGVAAAVTLIVEREMGRRA